MIFLETELDALTKGSFAKLIDLTVDIQNYADGDHHSCAFCVGVSKAPVPMHEMVVIKLAHRFESPLPHSWCNPL